MIDLLIFAKTPMPGKVKTRIALSIGDRGAVKIYKKMLYEILKEFSGMRRVAISICCYPNKGHPFFRQCQQAYPIHLLRQSGKDLGDRMSKAIARSLSDKRYVILIGADMPGIKRHHIEKVIDYLESGKELVLLPTDDGGYGLIALGELIPEIFKHIDWGTDKVMRQTLSRAERYGVDYGLLDVGFDIDTYQDYVRHRRQVGSVFEMSNGYSLSLGNLRIKSR